MDWLTFITKLVEALVWPAVVLVVLWLGRSRIAGLFDVSPPRRRLLPVRFVSKRFGGAEPFIC